MSVLLLLLLLHHFNSHFLVNMSQLVALFDILSPPDQKLSIIVLQVRKILYSFSHHSISIVVCSDDSNDDIMLYFLAHNSIYAERAICYHPSICPSVCHIGVSVKNGWS